LDCDFHRSKLKLPYHLESFLSSDIQCCVSFEIIGIATPRNAYGVMRRIYSLYYTMYTLIYHNSYYLLVEAEQRSMRRVTYILRTFFISCVVILFVGLFLLRVRPKLAAQYQAHHSTILGLTSSPTTPSKFTPVSGKGISTLHNVCIKDKKIVVYNSSATKKCEIQSRRPPNHCPI
jgi:hypothetical protein